MHNSRRGAILLLVVGALAADPAMPQAGPSAPATNEHGRAVHVLNRLAFGPRPGQVEAVEAMGVDRWIAQTPPGQAVRIRFDATRDYVSHVRSTERLYRRAYDLG